MKSIVDSHVALGICAASALLTACGGSPSPVGASGALPQVHPFAARSDTSAYNVLYRFRGKPDGAFPFAALVEVSGNLYGTTQAGGNARAGTVFRITTGGTEKTLYSFQDARDGAQPVASLTDANGKLYGTTQLGGGAGSGTVFSITTSGTETTLYGFKGGSDGAQPVASLTDLNGTLYGTTEFGGAYSGSYCSKGCGTVFSITNGGKENVLHSFGSGTDGKTPLASLLAFNDQLYGTTAYGGKNNNQGTIFSITTSGTEKVLHSFCTYCDYQLPDGTNPAASMIEVNETLYGTGYSGGCNYFAGAVFAFDPTVTRGGLYGEKTFYCFGRRRHHDGAHPAAGLIYANGTFYGTTEKGGTNDKGTAFSLTTGGFETLLHSFGGSSDGAYPKASLIDVNGTLYGTTEYGGTHSSRCPKGCGTIFTLTP